MLTDNIGAHPAIARTLATGYPDGTPPDAPHCPVCGEETDTVYTDYGGEIVGCNNCLTPHDAWERMSYEGKE